MIKQIMQEDMSDDDLLKMSQKRKNIESEKMNSEVKKTSSQMSTESESDFLLTQCDYYPKSKPSWSKLKSQAA